MLAVRDRWLDSSGTANLRATILLSRSLLKHTMQQGSLGGRGDRQCCPWPGRSWSAPVPIPASIGRPPTIRDTGAHEVYPGTLTALPDGRLLLTWQYIATGDWRRWLLPALPKY